MRNLGDRSDLFWLGVCVVASLVLAPVLVLYPMALIGLIGSVMAVAVFAKRPQFGFIFWLLMLAVIPCWIGVTFGGIFVPATLIGSFAALTCLLTGARWSLTKTDGAVIVMLAACAAGVFIGAEPSSMSAYTQMFTLWIPGYLVGRLVCERAGISFVSATTAVVFGVVGLLAIAENLLSWHPFSSLGGMNLLADIWAPIQIRGGEERSEWAFGHSIALGGSLALAIPFVFTAALKTRTKLALLVLILGGVALTYSRGAMLAAGLTLALTLLTTQTLKSVQKALLIAVASGLGVYTAIRYFTVAEEAGSEVADSSSYRVALFTRLIGTLEPIGRANSYRGSGLDGQTYYNNFTSIDNAFMALGLGFGWIAMLVIAVPFFAMGVRLLRRKASFAEVALLGQLPVITTVAMITQYQVFVWMVAGLAVTLASQNPPSPTPLLAAKAAALRLMATSTRP